MGVGGGGGGWLDQVRLKLTQSPTKVGVEVGTELGNISGWTLDSKMFLTKVPEPLFLIISMI